MIWKFIWLAIVPNNRSAVTVLHLYLEALQTLEKMPQITRSDGGTENTLIAAVQHMAYGDDARIYGSSTRNTRIEGAWRQMRERSMDLWMDFFKPLVETGFYNTDDDYHVSSAHFCFGQFITDDLEVFKETWNRHRIRKDGRYGTIGGVPDVLDNHSDQDFALEIPQGLITHVANELAPQNDPIKFNYIAASNYLALLTDFKRFQSSSFQFTKLVEKIGAIRKWFSSDKCKALPATDVTSVQYWTIPVTLPPSSSYSCCNSCCSCWYKYT